MKIHSDFETDTVNARRFGGAEEKPASPPTHGSWLDRLARRLAPTPVDHVPVQPMHLATAQHAVRCHLQPDRCVNLGISHLR
jgi:hypothetical protein